MRKILHIVFSLALLMSYPLEIVAEDDKLLTKQVKIKGGWFMFGSEDYYDEKFLQARQNREKENQRIREMKDQVGAETFDLIQKGLQEHDKEPMAEHPTHTRDGGAEPDAVHVKTFRIDPTAVSIRQFRRFVKLTKFKTEAEKFGWSFVLRKHVSAATEKQVEGPDGLGHVKETPWWLGVLAAYWRRPEGPDSTITGRGNDPVTHISWNDAKAYCEWAGGRLPKEREWEYAARGGLDDLPFPWGTAKDESACNGWQGKFPDENLAKDGYDGVAPVDAYAPNGFGLYNVVGNVWEWVAGGTDEKRIMRGGSFVDSISGRYNHLLRSSTRMENSGDSAGSNTGFRCASNVHKSRRKKNSKSASAAENEL